MYSMDLHAGTSCAWLPDNLRARLDAVEAARGGGADERPLAPFPPRPDTPPAVIAAGDEAEEEQEAENKGDEEAYGPRESALALMYEDNAGPDVYAGMDVDRANAPLLPMPTAVPPLPLGSCEQRHCRFHAAEGPHTHRLTGTGRQEAGMLASGLGRYEFQRPGQVARERVPLAESPDDGQVRGIQLGDAAALDHHPGDVRAAEPQEGLPLSVRLSVGRLLDEAGLEDVRRDGGLYVAMWRGGADAWRRDQAMRPLTPQALGSHALLVAMHPEGAKVVFGTDRVLLAGDGVVSLVPTSSSYRLRVAAATPGCWWWWARASTRAQTPKGPSRTRSRWGMMRRQAVKVTRRGRSNPRRRTRRRTSRRRLRGRWTCTHVEAALTRIMAAAGPPPTTEALEEEDQRRMSDGAQDAMEQDEEPEIVGVKEAHEVGPQELGVADKAGPKTGEVETCRHWAKGWCMRVDACRYAHRQLPVPQGVPQDLLLILQAMARVAALSQSRSRSHGTLMREVVEKAQGGGLPAVGYAVACEVRTEWAVALPCGMAALLTPFPVVPWRDMVAVQEANLGWVCTWHTHPAGMDPREWQAKAVMTYLSWSLPTAPVTWAQWWDRALH